MAAFINVEKKHIKFLLKQPRVRGAIQFPKNTIPGQKLKLVEPNNLLSLVLKLGRYLCLQILSTQPTVSPNFLYHSLVGSLI